MNADNDQYVTKAIRKRGRIANVLLVLALAIQLIAIISSPSEVPLHWGADGEADAYGSPWLTLIVWFILAIVVALCKLTATHVSVKYWNKPSKIQPGELEGWYAHSMKLVYNTSLMISIMALGIAIIYLLHAFEIMFVFIIVFALFLVAYCIYGSVNWRKSI